MPKKTTQKKKPDDAVRNDDLLLNICLDASGSMGYLTDATINGLNQFIEEQRAIEGDVYISLTLFNRYPEVRLVAIDIDEFPPLSRFGPNPYVPDGGTALYDALATTIQGAEAWQKNNPWFKGKILTISWTDGGENSSTTYSRYSGGLARLQELIKGKQAQGWDFAFMGAGNDAWLTAQDFASVIPQAAMLHFDANPVATAGSYSGLSNSVRTYRSSSAKSFNFADSGSTSEQP